MEIQGFTREQLERALDEAGSVGDTISAAALRIALHNSLPEKHQEVLLETHEAILERLLEGPEERAQAERAATDLNSWLR